MVERTTIPTRHSDEVRVSAFDTGSIRFDTGSFTLSVRGDRVTGHCVNDKFVSVSLWNGDNIRTEVKVETHVWRALDVWLSHHVDDHTAE